MTYQVEPWTACQRELIPHFLASWREVEAADVCGLPLDPDWEQYAEADGAGWLQVVTARDEAVLAGYHISLVVPHLHYKGMLSAATDTFYVLPAWRKGWMAYRLMRAVEAAWQARGVYFAATMTKLACDRGAFFERLGWHPSERLYFKVYPQGG